RPPAQFALQIGNGGLGGAAGAVWSRAAGAEQGMMEQSAAARLAADSLIGSLCFPPLVRISPVGMADPLDQRGFFGVQFPCPLDGFRLGRADGAGSFRIGLPDGVIALRPPLYKQLILVHFQ